MLITDSYITLHVSIKNNTKLKSYIQWELYGIIYTWSRKVSSDLQMFIKHILVQAWNRRVVHSTH